MSPPPQDVYLGLDLGTSGLKAVARSEDGRLLAEASYGYPTRRPAPGAAEQDPADWLEAARRALAALDARVPSRRWKAIGLTAMIPTLVLTDGAGTPIAPAVTWQDSRAGEQAARWVASCGDLYQSTGQRVDGRYLVPMALRCLQADPHAAARAEWMLGAKDYLFWWLTGRPATDPSTATGAGCYALDAAAWNDPALARAAEILGATPPALPPVQPSTAGEPLDPVRAAELGIPVGISVVIGAADSVCGAAAFGAEPAPGDVACLAGTSTVILGASTAATRDPQQRFLITPLVDPGSWGLEMDLLATGSATHWLGGLLGSSPGQMIAAAERADVLRAPVFLPYLAPGEQGALWDEAARGQIVGLDLGHSAADLARALLTGIVIESRRCLEVLVAVTGQRGRLHLGGGGASPALAQDLADASDRLVVLHGDAAPSAIGAALAAQQACSDHGAGPSVAVDQGVAFEPRAERASVWQELERRHEDARLRFSQGDRAAADARS